MVNLLSFFIGRWNSKTKAKPSGLPDSNFIFFVATKKTKQKKAWRCAGHVWLVRAATSIRIVLDDQESTLPPQKPRLLRASPSVETCVDRGCFGFPLVNHTERSGPLTQGRIPITAGSRSHRNPAKEMPSARRRHFCILLLPDKSMASGGTQPADFVF